MLVKSKQQRQEAFIEAQRQQRLRDDIAMMQDPKRWPKFGVLPVVKRKHEPGEFPVCGFLRVWDQVEPVVYEGNIHALATEASEKSGGKGGGFVDLSKLPQTRYLDFEALAAEWRVD